MSDDWGKLNHSHNNRHCRSGVVDCGEHVFPSFSWILIDGPSFWTQNQIDPAESLPSEKCIITLPWRVYVQPFISKVFGNEG
jgi:hypothetical protein